MPSSCECFHLGSQIVNISELLSDNLSRTEVSLYIHCCELLLWYRLEPHGFRTEGL